MTPAEIDNLPAGWETDALVAEKFMGICAHIWEWKDVQSDLCPTCGDERNMEYIAAQGDYPTKICKKCAKQVAGLAYRVGETAHCKKYSTDIAVANSVLEKILQTHKVTIECDQRGFGCFAGGFDTWNKQLPMAICQLAIVLAKSVVAPGE